MNMVKASKIANLTDARYFAAYGVEYLGFNCHPSSEAFVEPSNIKQMMEWIEGPELVMELGAEVPEVFQEIYDYLKPELVEVEGGVPAALSGKDILLAVKWNAMPEERIIWKVLKDERLRLLVVDRLLVEKMSTILESSPVPVIISGDIEVGAIEELLALDYVKGFEVKGGKELMTGAKSFEALDELMEVLKPEA